MKRRTRASPGRHNTIKVSAKSDKYFCCVVCSDDDCACLLADTSKKMHGQFSWGTSEAVEDGLLEYKAAKSLHAVQYSKDCNRAVRVIQQFIRIWLSVQKMVPVYILCTEVVWKGEPGRSGAQIDMEHVHIQCFNYFDATVNDVFTYMVHRLQLGRSETHTLRTLGLRVLDHDMRLIEANKMRSLVSAKQGLYYELVEMT